MNEHFGREISPKPPVQPPFAIGTPEVGHQIVRRHEARRLPGMDGCFG
jgi:hypothetical protein